ncbi:MAG: J domain-containing protein [Sphingobacteriales bacterium]|nr:J domain-containing protein [Sphingobacteriales bacterium]OJV98421.1 MAG: hypothetical protein BGO52_11575 [Sphingobacteriales bacterium 44-61]
MTYFKDCKTIDEVKATYKKLAKQYHPDLGGDTATMQTINREYAYACAHIAKDSGMTDEQADEQVRYSEQYRSVIEKIINLPGIVVELVGGWIWVTGDTFPVRKQLKTAGLFFAHKKLAWYFRSDEYKTRGGKKSLAEIKRKYGSERISKEYSRNELND